MADYQIGDNLFADVQGKYYRVNNGQRAYEESPYDAMSKRLNDLYDNQRKTQLDQLRQQRDKAISGFNQQKQDLRPQYQNQRNQADVVNAQNVSRLRELMAANGINASGENLTTQASMASSRQNAFNDINNNENQAMGAIDRQIADANDPSREQAIINAIETERSGKLADAYGQSQQDIYQKYQDWQNYQMQQQQLAMQRAAAARSGSSRRGGGGSGGSGYVKPKTKDQSYRDGMSYWADKVDQVRQEGAYRVAQGLRNDPAQMRAITDQGYDFESVIDALYNVASNGQFKNQSAYTKYVNDLNKAKINEKKQSLVDKYR